MKTLLSFAYKDALYVT